MNTGNAKMSGAQREKGPRSLYDSVGRRKTPLPMTALMHMATKPQKPTARTSFSVFAVAIAPQHVPRQGIRHRSVAQHRDAVHDNVQNPFAEMVRIIVRGHVPNLH